MFITMKVQILSSKVIKPSNPTPLHLKQHKISFLDQLASPIHFGIVFFFPSNNENSSNKCDHLEKSLSATLSRYYPLAGMFFKGDFIVDCNDQGVEFSRAKVRGEIAGIVRGSPEMKLIDALVPDPVDMARSDPWPVLAVQINAFDCGGVAVGIRILHTLGDGVSVLAFVEDWAAVNRTGLLKQEVGVCGCPSFELGSLFPARKLVELKPLPPANFPPNRLLTKCFLFGGATIAALKSEAEAPGELAERRPSRVQVVTAHIWRTLIQISQSKHGHSRPSLTSFALSLRGRLPFAIPENSYGTLVGHTTVQYNPGETDTDQLKLNTLVGLLRNSITKTSNDFMRARNSDEVYSMLIDYYNEIGGHRPSEVDLCRFTSWCGFSCYGVDFGWGKPNWVATVSKGVELVFLLDDESGDGVEAWVTLNEDDMVEFECRHLDQRTLPTVGICSKL